MVVRLESATSTLYYIEPCELFCLKVCAISDAILLFIYFTVQQKEKEKEAYGDKTIW